MTMVVFQQWLRDFNVQMQAQGCHELLLVDNVTSLRLDSPLNHVEVRALSPNTTAVLLHQDAGIIGSFKAQITHLQLRDVDDRFDDLLERVNEVNDCERERES